MDEKNSSTIRRDPWLKGVLPRRTPGVPTHRPTIDATPVVTDDDTRVYRPCTGARMYYFLDRADASLEVSILGSYLRVPMTGSKESLRRVTRYLLGTQDACIKLRVQRGDPVLMEWRNCSDSDWAGDPVSRTSQSRGHVDADGGAPSIILSETELRVNEQWPGRVLRDVLEGGGAVAFERSTGTLRVQSRLGAILSLGGSAWDCSTCWVGTSQGFGGEDAVAARNCSRSGAADQGGIFEVEKGRLWDSSSSWRG